MSALANDLGPGFKILWYKIESVLGRGGFGITYLATDINLGQLVAIKEYLPHEFATRGEDSTVRPVSKDQENTYNWGLERFMSEAQILAKFRHPNVVRVLSVFKHNNTGYMVMEYEDGNPLNKIYAEKKLLSQSELEGIYYPIIEGLIEVHKQGFIHRDIKPSNIFIRDDGSPVLIDFGAARHAVGSKTRTLTAMLTIGYAPFEQYNEGSEKQGPWTDIYALSACLHEGVTGAKPIDSMQRGMALLHNEQDPYTPLSWRQREGFSHSFLRGIDQGLMIQVHDRPQTLQEFHRILQGNIQLADIPPRPINEDSTLLVKTLVRPVQKSVEVKKDLHEDDNTVRGTTIDEHPETSDLGIKPRTAETAPKIDPAKAATKESQPGLWQKQGKLISAALLTIVVGLLVVILWPENKGDAPEVTTIAPPAVTTPPPVQAPPVVTTPPPVQTPPVVTAPPPVQTPIDTRQRRIDELLQQADQYYMGRIYFNSGTNHALDRYRQVLSLDKQNQLAIERIQEIGKSLLAQADDAIDVGNLDDAGFLLNAVADINPDFTGLEGVHRKLEQARLRAQEGKRLENLLNLADQAMNAGLLYSPENKSALAYYRQVLKIDPKNTQANQGLERIADRLVAEIRKMLDSGQLDRAENLLARLESTSPDHPAITRLKGQVSINRQIQRLIRKAEVAYNNQQYTIPESGSAASLYRQVLTLSPGHKIASSRLDDIANRYSTAVRNAIRSGKIKTARYNLDILSTQFPQHGDIRALSADLKALQTELDNSRLLPVGIEQNQGDDAVVEAIVDKFVRSFKSQNIKNLKLVSQLNERQERLYASLFKQYLSLNLTLVPASYTINKNRGRRQPHLRSLN